MHTTLPKIDIAGLQGAMARVAGEIRGIKQVLRAPWPEGEDMAPRQWELIKLQRRATELCVLRARLRGRFHLNVAPRPYRDAGVAWDQEGYHAKIAERVAGEFLAVEVKLAG